MDELKKINFVFSLIISPILFQCPNSVYLKEKDMNFSCANHMSLELIHVDREYIKHIY